MIFLFVIVYGFGAAIARRDALRMALVMAMCGSAILGALT